MSFWELLKVIGNSLIVRPFKKHVLRKSDAEIETEAQDHAAKEANER